MGVFEYVMVLVSIVIGLAITHILSAAGATIHRLRGHGMPIRLDPVFLLWAGWVLTMLVSFWWWEFRLQETQVDWTFGLYLFLITYAIGLFLLTVILIPHRMEDVKDSFEYFMAGRRWFLGGILLVVALDIGDTMLKGAEWALRPAYLAQQSILVSACLVGMIARGRWPQVVAAAAAFTSMQVYMFREMGIL